MTIHRYTFPVLTNQDIEKFWAYVDKDGPIPSHKPELGNCWIFTGERERNGYGYFWVQKHEIGAHRVAYHIQTGKIPDPELDVMHLCDNRKCQRKSHLAQGSRWENLRDAVLKGRTASGVRHGSAIHPELVPKGNKHYGAKITEEIVTLVRERYRNEPNLSAKDLGKEYKISYQNMYNAIVGKTWQHVPGAVHPGIKNTRAGKKRGPYNWKNPWKASKRNSE